MRDYLEKILNYDISVMHGLIEETEEEALIPYKIKYTNQKIIVYGAGSKGQYVIAWLKKHNIVPTYVIDGDDRKEGQKMCGYPIISIDTFDNLLGKDKNFLVLNAVSNEKYQEDIKNIFISRKINDVVFVNRANIFGNTEVSWQYYLDQHRDELYELLENLYDEESKRVLCEYIRTIFMDDFYRLEQIPSSNKYFEHRLIKKKDDERFFCVGGSSGDTIYYFLDLHDQFDSITCFEGDKECYDKLSQNLQVLPDEIKKKIVLVDKYISDTDGDEKMALDLYTETVPSYVSLDIEGMELEALSGAKKLIENGKTVFAISAYHKQEDLIDFWNLFKKYRNQYQFIIRKYAAQHVLSKNELVFYAVPNYRIQE